ncbi:MAG: protein translocase subunit SecD [Candidatus Omnitrophica bacterium]|nr:protein translocase subunit SecD [Candidatus Omnitrophota bacterium]
MYRNLKWRVLLVIAVVGFSVWQAWPLNEKIQLGLDLQGGMHLVLRVDTTDIPEKGRADAAERALEVIRNRIDEFGVKEPSIQQQGEDRILIQLPGVTDRQRALELIGQTAHLEFKVVSNDSALLQQALAGTIPEGYELLYDEKIPLLLQKEAALTGEKLVDARLAFDSSRFNEPYVGIEIDGEGAKLFAAVTAANVGRRLAIVLDGKIRSAPVINEPIPSGNAQITGNFTVETASDLSIVLRSGALPAPLVVEEERTVGPALGSDSIQHGIQATLIGGVLVVIFMAVYYLFCGLLADIALLLNLVVILGALAAFGATLTLPGIAGIILTIGMAVDANVLIYERIREELKLGRSLQGAVDNGYKRVFWAIFDSNVTTLVSALILFWLGTGPVRGFAITLTIGLFSSMFTALVVTRVLFDLALSSGNLTRLTMLQLISEPKIDYIRLRKVFYGVSLAVVAAGMVFFVARGEKNLSVEFSGGAVQEFYFEPVVPVDQIRNTLAEIGLGNATIQQVGDDQHLLIRTAKGSFEKIHDKLLKAFPDRKIDVLMVENIGPVVSNELKRNALLALMLSLFGICAYVGFRFEWRFAIAAIIALLHDVLVTIGAVSFSGREVSVTVIAAVLTVAGYSINDTIVIFDRIRENMRLLKKLSFKDLVNLSVNQTMSRTLLTSLTVFLVVLTLYFLGGEVINDFAFAMVIGLISGSYSTIFVASPLLVGWKK